MLWIPSCPDYRHHHSVDTATEHIWDLRGAHRESVCLLYTSNPVENKISDESPVGRALLGHHVGDQIDVETPGGTATYKVVEITQ